MRPAMTTTLEKLAEFARWALEDGSWVGHDLDGSDVERKALALGLIKEVKYDPGIHGESEIDIEPGDPWFVLSDDVTAVLPTPK
jgi:hypothetical protein